MQAMVPLQMSSLLKAAVPGLVVQEAGWYQQFTIAEETGVEIIYLPAAHWHQRGLNDMNKVLWGSFLLRTPHWQLYFAGDTAYKDHFKEINQLFGAPDICFIPIGAYKPAFMMDKSHLNPAEAVQAFNELGGKTFIPMHFGTFDLSDEPAGEPLRLLEQFAAAGQFQGTLRAPAIGEFIPLPTG
jgi:L-ascorbate metabolism protein UlaG (beta-lactamase superfamily)